MRRSFVHFVFVPTLLSLLLLAFSGGLSQAQREGSVEGLQKYLDTYEPSQTEAQGKDDPTVTDEAEASDPPLSMFADKAALVVRVMPASYQSTSMDRRPDAPYTWPSRPLVVWGRVDGGTAPYSFQMEFGDGSAPVTGNVDGTVGRKTKYIAVAHTYATGGPKLARLTVTDALSQTASRDIAIHVEPFNGDERNHDMLLRRNAAVQDGLRWLYLQQASNGSWPGGGYWYVSAATAAAIAAFEIQGYYPSDDPTTQIYAEFLRTGLEYLFSGLRRYSIVAQAWGNPDSNGDTFGLRSNEYCGAYLHGLIMYAIALSREPDAIAVGGGAGVVGRTYREILTNMVDQLAYSQGDGGWNEGGWRYNVCTPNDEGDNSAVQWATIGLDAAEVGANGFGIHAPPFVKSELKKWLVYSRSNDGGYGYTSPGGNVARTGSGIFSEFYCGLNIDMTDPANDLKILTSRNFLNTYWCNSDCSFAQFPGNLYAMYAVKKALDDLKIIYLLPPQTTDWYADYVHFLVKGYTTPCVSNGYHQVVELSDPALVSLEGHGYWPADCYVVNSTVPATCFAVLILVQGVYCDLYASASGDASVCPESPVLFRNDGSHSTCPGVQVTDWRWDFDDQNGTDINNPDATGPTATNPTGYPLAPGVAADSVYATLWVIDDATPPDTAMTKHMVIVTRLNHKPVACLNGPFTACVGDPIYLDACCSYDPDTGTPCGPDSLVLYEWDLGGDGSIDFTSTTCRPENPIIYNEEKTVSVLVWVTDTRGARSDQAATNLIWSSFRDLRVTAADIEFVPVYPQCGAEGQIRAKIHATVQGGAPPIAETKVRIYHDQYVPQNPALNLICEQTLTNLVDGQVVEVQCAWAPPAATEIIVVADAANQVQECLETDNIASKLWTCGCWTGVSQVLPTQWNLGWLQGDGGTVRWILGGGGEFSVSTVDPASLRLNGTVPALQTAILPEMTGFVGPVLVARFSRWEAMRSCAQQPGPQQVTLTGGFLNQPSQCLLATASAALLGVPEQPEATSEEGAGVSNFGIRGVRPNPTSGGTEIEFGMPSAGAASFGIFDSGGRLVRTLAEGSYTRGYHKAFWNGRNNDGQPVSAGVYFVRGRYADKQVEKRIVIVQ